jgi:Na+/H+ antiporter NhaC
VDCAFGNVIAEAVFLIIALVLGLVLLWIGAAIGAWIGLRVRRYLGAKTTALFLAILMIPWTIAMLWVIGTVTDNLTVAVIIAPILLTAVPGLLARGAVLLLRTRHL